MTIEALIGQIEVISRQAPTLMVFEDAHWADPSSLEVLGRLMDKMQKLRALLIVTFRPEFTAAWIGRPHVTALTVNRLAPGEVITLIDHVAGNRPLSSNIRQDIIERADGIPLFVEEMTKAVVEAEGDDAVQRTVASVPSPALSVPASLHASLMARLDRLGSAKAVAQIGAAIGREFSYAWITSVARLPEEELSSALERLVQSGLLSRQGLPPHATYLFKHALVQDAAYGTLLREPRRALHARIAQILESQFPDIAESRPELLARHFTEAGLIEKSSKFWGMAGLRSLARSALLEAEAQLSRAVAQIATLPSNPGVRKEQTKLQIGLANALMHTKGFSAVETKAALEQARLMIERAEQVGEPSADPLALFSVLWGFWASNFVAFNGETLRRLSAQFLALAEKQSAIVPLMLGHRVVGISLLFTGDVAEGRLHLDRALSLYDPLKHRSLTTIFGQDAGVALLSYRSIAMWLLGYPDAAKTDAAQALNSARKIGHLATLLTALIVTSSVQLLMGHYSAARIQSQDAIALADEKGALFWQTLAMASEGLAIVLGENTATAVSSIIRALSVYRSTGATVSAVCLLSYLAKARATLGQFKEARSCNLEAMTLAEKTGERWFDAEICRVSGEIALLSSELNVAKAQTEFERALQVARAQQAKSLELRAATSLARLWRDQGQRTQAHDLLAPVYGWFTEGFDTIDLKEAKALLAELV